MKTAISIPDQVFESAEKLASQLGQSRSQLYTKAINSYIDKHRGDDVTKKLDQVYGQIDSSLDPKLQRLQSHSLPKEEW